ncbi:hypothetical protein [Guptibacillus spartinae]|uniref:hypothetical protein n=1 Tax=Guptibacillus spartinae TaxID=3025679 RepID=UPI0023601C73|nr:hypothetical protein [Pseudalkalibacillus spartinae]
MVKHLNDRLKEVEESEQLKNELEKKLDQVTERMGEAIEKKSYFNQQLERDKNDVEKLKRVSLDTIKATLKGTKEERVMKENQEMLIAKQNYDQAVEEVKELEEEQRKYISELNQLGDPQATYEKLINEKAAFLLENSTAISIKVLEAYERETACNESLQEVNKAIGILEGVIAFLQEALKKLDKAKGWGTVDLLGGGPISSLVKHRHMDEAKDNIEQAQIRFEDFQRELSHVKPVNEQIVESELLTSADILIDSIIFDWIVQDKIYNTEEEVKKQLRELEHVMRSLVNEKKMAREQVQKAKQKRIALVKMA